MTEIEYPDMRVLVVGAIRALSDSDYQWRIWVRREFPNPTFCDNLTARINALDDLQMLDNPEEAIGDVLRNHTEAEAMGPLSIALNAVFDELGTERSDEEYLHASGWPAVLKAAQSALETFTAE